MKRFFVLPLAFACFGVQAQSTQAGALGTDTLAFLQPVVVTATRGQSAMLHTPEATAELRLDNAVASGARTLPEALVTLPGVPVQKTNHAGGSPFILGQTGNGVLYLVDGIRFGNAIDRFGPSQLLNTFDLFAADRLEVLYGGGAVTYGSGALGGTLQVFSAQPAFAEEGPEWHGRVLGRLLSQGMEETAHGSLGYATRRIAATGGITYRHFGDPVGGDTTGFQRPNGYRELAANGKVRLRVGANDVLTLAHFDLTQRGASLYHKVRLENFAYSKFDPQRHQLSYARWEGNRGRSAYSLAVSRNNTDEGRQSRKTGATVRVEERDRVETWGATADMRLQLHEKLLLHTGGDIYRDLVHSQRHHLDTLTGAVEARRGLYPDGSRMASPGLFALAAYTTGPWHLNAGARYNAFRIDLDDPDLARVRLRSAATVWNLAALRQFGRSNAAYLTFHTGFRAPNIDDAGTLGIVDFRFETPNYDLAPEKSYNALLGWRTVHHRVRAQAFLFRSELRDLIVRTKTDSLYQQNYPVYRKENAGRAYIQGAQGTLWLQLFSGWSVEGQLAYTVGQNESLREPMRRMPPLQGRLALTWQRGMAFATAEALGADRQDRLAAGDKQDNRIPAGGTPGWTVLNFFGGYRIRDIELSAGLQNLFNRDYRVHGSGMNGVGRSAWLQVSWRFDKSARGYQGATSPKSGSMSGQ